MKLRVTHYSGDRLGGAARAALRVHATFRQHPLVTSNMVVAEQTNDDPTIRGLNVSLGGKLGAVIRASVDAVPRRLAAPSDLMPRSAAWASRITGREVNRAPSDVAHLHWINGAFLSVEQIGKITKPLVWTMHDMWPFCGAEHLSPDAPDARWRTGYIPSAAVAGFDVDRWTWKRKMRSWRQTIQVVTPSRWLADCVRTSMLMGQMPIHVIPNPLDVTVYKPLDKVQARLMLNLPLDRKLVLFGAIKGTQLTYKGWDLLMPALASVGNTFRDADAVVFGQSLPSNPPLLPLSIHWMGHLYDDFSLAALYSAADVLVIPSRQEAFGQTGSEAHACGCPVVAFDATGLKDVVDHDVTGLLVKPYDAQGLASAIVALLANDDMRRQFGIAARSRAQRLWSYSTVADQYKKVYDVALHYNATPFSGI